jgi:hypothetical protein
MTSFTQAIDQHNGFNSTQLGENNHQEFSWSESKKDKIVQLYYQINRCSKEESQQLATVMYDLLTYYKDDETMKNVLYKMIMFTRDMIDGKGERRISFDFIYQLARIDLESAKKIIYYFVHEIPNNKNESKHQYGSWRDLKILWSEYNWKSIGVDPNFMITMINDQLRKDRDSKLPTLVAKWIPREKSKYKTMFYALAEDYFHDYLITPTTSTALTRAKCKAYTNYRKILTELNRKLDTVQIKQCGENYSTINYDNVTSITMTKQKNAFLNTDKNGNQRSTREDRIKGAANLKEFTAEKKTSGNTIKGTRVSVYDFVKDAMYFNRSDQTQLQTHIDILNSQWEDAGKSLHSLENYVAMVDTSGSMTCDNNIPLYNSIGLGCRIAEKSNLGRRVLTFNDSPSWVNLEKETTLCSMISKISASDSQGYGTNFTAALELILDSVVKARLTNDVVKDIALVILSDMQIDGKYNENMSDSMWDLIKEKYAEAGKKLHGVPYDIPCIVFWNLRTTTGFPTLTNQRGASMMSGSNPNLINSFCKNGLTELRSMTPWDIMLRNLHTERYAIFK